MPKVPLVTRVGVTTAKEADGSIVTFHTKEGVIRVGLKNKELSRLAALLIEQSQKVAVSKNEGKTQVGVDDGLSTLTVRPIQTSAVGVGPGRTRGETLLSVEIGNLTLCFAADAETLEGTFHALKGLDQMGKPRRTN